jgi:DnaJ-class molecular chaperone
VSEQATEPTAPESCTACRGTGSVISNLGGEPHQLSCPWCEGGGVVLPDHDAQAHWRAQQGAERD